jgi:hypothetical protein
MKRRTLALLIVPLLTWGGYQMWADHRPVDTRKPVDTPRPLDKSQLEAALREKYDLETVALEEGAPGRFAGTGRNRQGKAYRFEVKQGEKSREVTATWDEPNAPSGVGESHWGLRW